jgi:peptide/nickel transport system ATP-binding protein
VRPAPSPGAALVEVQDLSVAYNHDDGWLRVVDGVTFTIAKGEAFGLVGESGCGKSTVAYHLLGYRRPYSRVEGGRVIFQGVDLLRLDRPALDTLRGDRISLVPQNPTTALSPGMRVGEQIAEVLRWHGRTRGAGGGQRIVELFGLVGLPEPERIGRRYPHQLSGGQQQRVTIAMALACAPGLLVLDEPTTGLDVTTQEQIIELLADLRARLGMSMLYVTHDLGVLAEIADRVGVMYAGHLVEIAPTDVLFSQPRHPYTRGLSASIPRLDDTQRPVGQSLRGMLRRDEIPPGCPFSPRCDFAQPSCAINVQRPEIVVPGHAVACQRWREIGPPGLVGGPVQAAQPRAMASAPLLALEDVSLSYGGRSSWRRTCGQEPPFVVRGVSFSVEPGETFALVGESGSGKSTLARAISGVIAPAHGQIRFSGKPLPGLMRARSDAVRQKIQYIFQNPDASLNPRRTVGDTIGRPLKVFFQLRGAKIRERVAALLEDVRLDASYAERYPDQLSGGERQRVSIARALACEPALLLCDEILSALDVSVQASIIKLLERLRAEHDLAMLFIAHDLAVVRGLADRVGVLFGGQLFEVGATRAVFELPFHPYTHELLMAAPGPKPANALPRAINSPTLRTHRGCAYAHRCPWKLGPICEQEVPPWRAAAPDLEIRCHREIEDLRARAVWRPFGGQKSQTEVANGSATRRPA